jgi:hypothetical protein
VQLDCYISLPTMAHEADAYSTSMSPYDVERANFTDDDPEHQEAMPVSDCLCFLAPTTNDIARRVATSSCWVAWMLVHPMAFCSEG